MLVCAVEISSDHIHHASPSSHPTCPRATLLSRPQLLRRTADKRDRTARMFGRDILRIIRTSWACRDNRGFGCSNQRVVFNLTSSVYRNTHHSQPAMAIQPAEAGPSTPPHGRQPQYKLAHSMSGHARAVTALRFSPDGLSLVSAGEQRVKWVCGPTES